MRVMAAGGGSDAAGPAFAMDTPPRPR